MKGWGRVPIKYIFYKTVMVKLVCQIDTPQKRETELRNCLHQFGLWGYFLDHLLTQKDSDHCGLSPSWLG